MKQCTQGWNDQRPTSRKRVRHGIYYKIHLLSTSLSRLIHPVIVLSNVTLFSPFVQFTFAGIVLPDILFSTTTI